MLDTILRWLGLSFPLPFEGRAPGWSAVRAEHLRQYPECAACGSRRNCVPHHVVPVHVDPELELCETNLITLCEGDTMNCHLWWGHLGSYRDSWNPDVREDAAWWREKIERRP